MSEGGTTTVITATWQGVSSSATLTSGPQVAAAFLTLSPPVAVQFSGSTGTVTLTSAPLLNTLVFLSSSSAHGRRELVHVNVTANPTAAWVWRQLIEATPWGQKPRHLLRDRDAVYGRDFRQRAKRIGIDALATPVRSRRPNAVVKE